MGRALRIVLASMAGAVLGAVLGVVVWVGNATPMPSPVAVFTILGAAGGATLGLRARKGLGVARASFLVVMVTVAVLAVIAFDVVRLLWHDFNSGMLHP